MHVFGALRMAPWWRGPGLLMRRAGVVVALVAAAFVATLPAAAAAPFLSSARDATLHHQITAACPATLGLQISAGVPFDPQDPFTGPDGAARSGTDVVAARQRLASAAASGAPDLSPALTTLMAGVIGTTDPPGTGPTNLTLLSRTGFESHVQVLDGPRGAGLWLSDQYASFVHLKVGDRLTLVGQGSPQNRSGTRTEAPTMALPVAAIYRDLRSGADQPWWCGLRDVYRGPPGAEFSNRPVSPVVLVDQDTLAGIAAHDRSGAAQLIELGVADPRLDQDQARVLATRIATMRQWLASAPEGLFADDFQSGTRMNSTLPGFVAHADLARSGMLPAVVPITVAGLLVGLLVVGAATVFWVQRRRRELTVLSAHGVGAPALGLKAVTEVLPALLAGTAAGWGAAWLLVRWIGPDPTLSGEAAPLAALGAAVSIAAAALVVGLVATLACRSLTDQTRAHHHTVIRSLPWELLLLAAAPAAWAWLGGERQAASADLSAGTVAHVPGRLLVVPIMVVAGLTVLIGRVGVRWLRRRGRRRTPRPAGLFLGWRRISREAVMSAVLAGATAVPVALAAYGATVTDSVRTTIAAEAKLHLGSDVVVTLRQRAPIPASLADSTTEVLRLDGAQVGGVHTDVLAIDPVGFARDAFWVDSLGGSLPDLLAPLRTAGAGGATNAVASGPVPAGDQAAMWSGSPVLGGRLHIVSTGTLPAEQGGYPVALVAKDALGDDVRYARPQLWIRGDPDHIRQAVTAANLPVARINVATDQYANTLFEPLTYTFAYLTALSLLTSLVTLVGLLLYLESRTPAHRRAYVLLHRMGLRAGSHRVALLSELSVPLAVGLVTGVAVTLGLTATLSRYFEMNPTIPPDTVVVLPYPALAVLVAAVALIATGATGYAQRRVSRANPSEVLRDAI
jgi:putative ABC transport system permease protein